MHVDVATSRRYTRRIRRALRARARCSRSQRCAPPAPRSTSASTRQGACSATARYLTIAKARFGREDLAFVSYHMGMGNLQSVLRAYGKRRRRATRSSTSTPRPSATPPPTRSSPRSATTPPTTGGSSARPRRSCACSRDDAGELARLEAAQTAKNSAEEVLHPPGSTPRFATPAKLKQAWADEQIVAFPQNERVTGLRARRPHGRARRRRRTLYRGLRPEALAIALYIGAAGARDQPSSRR